MLVWLFFCFVLKEINTFSHQGCIKLIKIDSIDSYKKLFQIYASIKCSIYQRILKKFLKVHVTLKTGVKMLKIQIYITGINIF